MDRSVTPRIFVTMASGARGGGANHLLLLLPALTSIGVHVTACVGDDGPLAAMLQALGVDASAHPLMGSRLDVAMGRRLMAEARAGGASVVHAHGTRAAVLTALGSACVRRPLPRIYTAHGLAPRAATSWAGRQLRLAGERLACFNVGAVVSVSRTDLDLLRDLVGRPRWPAVHVPNVVRVGAAPQGEPGALRAAARTRFGLPANCQVVGTVSRLVRQKNVPLLADAVAVLPDVHLAVVGEGPDDRLLATHPLAQAGRLHLVGASDQVPAFLPALDVFALSSLWEGEPIALLEAMAHGLPWASTPTSGAQELQRSCGTGLVAAEHTPEALARCLRQLLQNASWAHRLGHVGQQAMAMRTPERAAETLLALYRTVAEQGGPGERT